MVSQDSIVTTTDYLSGFQYVTSTGSVTKLEFFPTAEGYVEPTETGGYQYVYNYTDHLGNIRLSYSDTDEDGTIDALTEIREENNYYPFGLKHKGYNDETINSEYKYKYQGQERQDELNLNWDSFKYRNYDYAIGRFMSIDPLAEKYAYNGVYNFSENRVIVHRELEGLESVYVFDQEENPDNRRVYTANVYVVHDEEGGDNRIEGPYSGSSYPNNETTSNTVNTGSHDYNNLSGHHGGTERGLNLVDENENRNSPGADPNGNDITMSYVNVHSGVDPAENNNLDNRGSAGCVTIDPDDATNFFDNFNWNEAGNTNTGTSSGTITIYRGGDDATTLENNIQHVQSSTNFQNNLVTPTPAIIPLDNTPELPTRL